MASKSRVSKIAIHGKAVLVVAMASGVHASNASAGEPSTTRTPQESGHIDIEWNAPAECPDAAAIRAATERLLGQSLDAPRSQRIAARARVHRNAAGRWEISFWLSSNGSVAEEAFMAERCAALGDAVALKVALAADPLAFVDAATTRAPGAVKPPTFVADEPPVEKREAERKTPLRVSLRVAGGAGLGLLPDASPGGALVGSIAFPWWRLELGAHLFAGSEVAYVDIPSVGASFDLVAGTARACAITMASPLELPICFGFEMGALGAKGFGVEPAYHPYRTWAALVLGPAWRFPLKGNLSLWLEVDAVVLLLRPSFRIRDLNELYGAPAAGARGWAGLEFALP